MSLGNTVLQAILYLLFTVNTTLFPMLNLLYCTFILVLSKASVACPVWLFSIVPWFYTFSVCSSGIFWMIFRCFHLHLLLLALNLFFVFHYYYYLTGSVLIVPVALRPDWFNVLNRAYHWALSRCLPLTRSNKPRTSPFCPRQFSSL